MPAPGSLQERLLGNAVVEITVVELPHEHRLLSEHGIIMLFRGKLGISLSQLLHYPDCGRQQVVRLRFPLQLMADIVVSKEIDVLYALTLSHNDDPVLKPFEHDGCIAEDLSLNQIQEPS